jgi:hypothetical protein
VSQRELLSAFVSPGDVRGGQGVLQDGQPFADLLIGRHQWDVQTDHVVKEA